MLPHLWVGFLVVTLVGAHPLAAPGQDEVCFPVTVHDGAAPTVTVHDAAASTVTVHDSESVTVYVTETETVKAVATAGPGYGSLVNSGSSDVVTLGGSGIYIEPSSPAVTLTPAVHWQHNLTDHKHIVPSYSGSLYYSTNGTSDSAKAHQFTWLNATYTSPVVILDYSSYITYVYDSATGTVTCVFGSESIYEVAETEWKSVSGQLILIAFNANCGDKNSADNCYFKVDDLTFDSKTRTITCDVSVVTFKSCLSKASSSWGRYSPLGSQPNYSSLAASVISSVISKYLPTTAWTATGPATALGLGAHSTTYATATVLSSGRGSGTGVPHGGGSGHGSGSGSSGSGSGSGSSGTGGDAAISSLRSSLSAVLSQYYPSSVLASGQAAQTGAGPVSKSIATSTPLLPSATVHPSGAYLTGSRVSGSGSRTTNLAIVTPVITSDPVSALRSSLSSVYSSMSSLAAGHSSNSKAHSSLSAVYSRISSSAIARHSSSAHRISSGCGAPSTDVYFGLPVACLGPTFDETLDAINGFLSINSSDFSSLYSLYPGLISTSSSLLDKRGELHNRCWLCDVWDDVTSAAEDVASAVVSVVSDATSVIESVATDVASAVVSAAEAVATDAITVGDDIETAAVVAYDDLSSAAEAIISDVEAGLSELMNYHGSTTISVDITAPSDDLTESPWGDQLFIHNFAGNNSADTASYSVNIFCVNCGITGSVDIYGNLEFDLTGITDIDVGISADLTVGAALGIDANVTLSKTFETTLFKKGIPDLCSGTFLCIGPYVQLDVSATLDIDAEGTLLVGGSFAFTNSSVDLFIAGGSSSESNWKPVFTPEFEASGDLTISAAFGLPVSIGVGIQVLDNTFNKDLALVATPSIGVSAEVAASVNVTSDGVSAEVDSTSGCTGIYIQGFYEDTLGYEIGSSTNGTLYDSGQNNFTSACIALNSFVASGVDAATSTTTTGSLSQTNVEFANVTLAIENSTSILTVCDGDVYVVSSTYSNSSCTNLWSAYTATSNFSVATEASIVVADSTHKLPVMFTDEMTKAGVSRLRLVESAEIPAKAEYLSFPESSSTSILHEAQTLAGIVYALYSCALTDDATRNKTLVVSSDSNTQASALEYLEEQELLYTVVGANTTSCSPIHFYISSVSGDS